jgi:micrococcal nuclease
MKILVAAFLFLACCLATLPVDAKNNFVWPQGNFSELRAVGSGKIDQVIDPQTIRMDDKRIIRLSGIEFPDFNPNMPGPFAMTGLKILKDLLEGKMVTIYQTQKDDWGRSNRMDQQLAHLEVQKGGAWVQGVLIQLGLARVMTDQSNPEMAAQMYDLENAARKSKSGLWSLERYKIITPEEAAAKAGGVAIVEGRIHSTAMQQNRIYLNFGPNWKSDFTITIMPENRRLFFDRNIDPLKWNNKLVRVRGWIGDYNGPFIDVDHPEQIQVLEDGDFPLKVTTQRPMLRSTAKH